MFESFAKHKVTAGDVAINLVTGGSGPPLLLLHGYPQCHVMWHRVAPILAREFTIVAADLTGYGDSDKPPGDTGHERYSKRCMAEDQVSAMAALGFERFAVAGHDRGGRVAHRMAVDHADRVNRVAVLDIAPTLAVFEYLTSDVALGYYHWFFLSQPHDIPERLIGADPEYFLKAQMKRHKTGASAFSDEAMAEYVRCFSDPAMIHASCEDYRAGATIDLDHDRADRDQGRKVRQPLLALWGSRSKIDPWYDMDAVWRERAEDVTTRTVDATHFLAEERPEETAGILADFFRADPSHHG